MSKNSRQFWAAVTTAAALSTIPPLGAFTPNLESALGGSPSHAYQRFGHAVAVEGLQAVVGAPGDVLITSDLRTLYVGAVFVYQRSPAGWGEVQKLRSPNPASGAQFGASVSLSGNTLAVGSPNAESAAGVVYVYERTEGRFDKLVMLRPPTAAAGQYFGDPVVVRGDWLAVGAYGDPDGPVGSGAVHMFHRESGQWLSAGKVKASDPEEYGAFGWSADLAAGRLAVGAPSHSVYDENEGMIYNAAGKVYVYSYAGGEVWTEEKVLVALPQRAGAQLGSAVSFSGGQVAAGAPGWSEATTSGGAVVIFGEGPGGWSQTVLTPNDTGPSGYYGASLVLRGEELVVGAPEDSALGADLTSGGGSVYLYRREGGAWTLSNEMGANVREVFDRFGFSLAFDGRSLAVGAPTRTPGACGEDCRDQGAVFLFETNRAPVAIVSPTSVRAESVNGVDAEVALDGSASVDPDADDRAFSWREGPDLLGTGSTLVKRFLVGQHTVVLEVSDDRAVSQVEVAVEVIPLNRAPVARVAQDRLEVSASGPAGAEVELDGSGSSDPDGDSLVFRWLEQGGDIATGVRARVTLAPGEHVVVLQVSDLRLSSEARMTVVVTLPPPSSTENHPPVADASRTVQRWIARDGAAALVLLDGRRSSDPDKDPLTFRWMKSSVPLASGAVASVGLPVGTHSVVLQVSDGRIQAETAVLVRVLKPVQAVKSLAAKLEGARVPFGKKSAGLAILKGAQRALERGQVRIAIQQLRVFEVVMSAGRVDQTVLEPLLEEARWIAQSLKTG